MMLNRIRCHRKLVTLTSPILLMLSLPTVLFAQVETILDTTPRRCTINHSRLDSSTSCLHYLITYNPEDDSFAHHFLFSERSGRDDDRIMLFSPESWTTSRSGRSRTEKASFALTGMLLISEGEMTSFEGSGRCQLNPNLNTLSCRFYYFRTEGVLTVNVDL